MISIQAYTLKTGMRFVRMLTGSGMPWPSEESDIPRQRKILEKLCPQPKLPTDYVVKPVKVDGVDAEWLYHKRASADKVVMDIHGGAFILGSIDAQRKLVLNIAKVSGARCVSVGHRLAPEHPYPAGLEDCLTVYRWLVRQGIPQKGIVIVGDSSGGNLALATMLTLKDEEEPLPAAVVLLSPCTDVRGTGESVRNKAKAEAVLSASVFTAMGKYYAQNKNLDHPG